MNIKITTAMIRLFCLLAVLTFVSCKGDKDTTTTNAATAEKKVEPPKFDKRIPDACELLSLSTIAKLVGTDANAIEVKDASNAQNLFSRSCFFKWEDPNQVNAGVMVQVMTNPVEAEAPEYLTLFVESKKTNGETTFDSDEKVLYKDFDGFGDDGAYSHELHKYIWRVGDDFCMMIAFNTTLNEDKELAAARELATELMQKM